MSIELHSLLLTLFQLTETELSLSSEKDLWCYFADEEARTSLGNIPWLSALTTVRFGLTLYFSSAKHVFLPQKLKQGYKKLSVFFSTTVTKW